LDHVFYSDGNEKKMSWIIQTNDSVIDQSREHVEIYWLYILDYFGELEYSK